jgi:hypothetical protein
MRNIISGNTADRTRVQVGYEKQNLKHTEGDIWEENGKQWTLKNGIKQSVTKYDKIREIITMPLKCPSCGGAMKSTLLNKKMWNIHKKCFDCVIEMETQLKIEGKYEQYAKYLMNSNKNSFVKDYEQAVEEYTNAKDDIFISEAGDIENWSTSKIDPEIIKALKANIKQLKETEI